MQRDCFGIRRAPIRCYYRRKGDRTTATGKQAPAPAELLWEAQGGCLRATTAQLAAAVAAAGEQAEALGRERRQSETEHSEAAHLEEELRGRTAQLGDVERRAAGCQGAAVEARTP